MKVKRGRGHSRWVPLSCHADFLLHPKTLARKEPDPVSFGISAHQGPGGRDSSRILAALIRGMKPSQKLPTIPQGAVRHTMAFQARPTIHEEVARGASGKETAGNTQHNLGGGHPEPMAPGGLGRNGPSGQGGTRRDRPSSKSRATVPAFAACSPPLVGPEGGPVPIGDQNRDSRTVEVPLVGGPDHFYGVEGDPPADTPTTALRVRRGEIDRATTTSRPSEVRDVGRGGRRSRQEGTTRPTRRLTSLHPNGPSAAARHNALARAFRRRWPLQRRGTNTPRRPGEGVGVGGPRDSRIGASPPTTQEAGRASSSLGPPRALHPEQGKSEGRADQLGRWSWRRPYRNCIDVSVDAQPCT